MQMIAMAGAVLFFILAVALAGARPRRRPSAWTVALFSVLGGAALFLSFYAGTLA